MPAKVLQASEIAKIKTQARGDKPLELWDAKQSGLHVRVSFDASRQSLKKVFYLRYRSGNKHRRLKLGHFTTKSVYDYSSVSEDAEQERAKNRFIASEVELGTGLLTLAEARGVAGLQRAEIAAKRDPQQDRINARQTATQAQEGTFADLADRYIKGWAERHKKASSVKEDQRQIDADLIPEWGNRPAREITKQDVIRLLEKIGDRGAPSQAIHTRRLLSKMFNFGIERDIVEANPALAAPVPFKEKPRERVLNDDEIERFWLALDDFHWTIAGVNKLKVLTAQRDNEIRYMRSSEIDGDVWTIPGYRTKNGREHRVPLSPQALRVIEDCRIAREKDLEDLATREERVRTASSWPNKQRDMRLIAQAKKRAEEDEREQWVFPSPSQRRMKGQPVGKTHKAIERIRETAKLKDFNGHDLRRTAATGMARLKVEPHVIGKVLSHSDRGITERVYLWHSYDDEKRRALEKWGRRVEEIITGEKRAARVVKMRRR